jgi:DNA-binding NarL/FixJ family response regulator
VRVLVAARDVRVRRALSRLLELDGEWVVAATGALRSLAELDAEVVPDLVVLELDHPQDAQLLQVVTQLARRGRAVIAVCSGSPSRAAVLAAGARAGLDKGGDFTDRLVEAVRALAGPQLPAPPG